MANEEKSLQASAIWWVLLLACSLRISAVIVRFENLQTDRDAYLGIAQNLLDGNGYCSTPGQPTAYRPPLYPILIAACLLTGGFVAVGIFQIFIGTVTVWLTWHLAGRCQFSQQVCLFAAILVAVDPLLIEYTTQPMTETLSTFLVTLLLIVTLRSGSELTTGCMVGVLLGLAALCRPSIWAFGGLAGTVWLIRKYRAGLAEGTSASSIVSRNLKVALLCISASALTVSPWVIRNTVRFGRPILMTTHGGYTLLLANNETFFNDVVAAQGGTTWTASSLNRWQNEIERQLSGMELTRIDEVSRDSAMSQMAKDWIFENPLKFVRSSILKLQRFWACRPSVSAGIPSGIVNTIGVCYLGIFALTVVGLVRFRVRWCKFWTLPALVLVLSLVHSVYWSNARMRSAIVPVISLTAAGAFQRSSVKLNSSTHQGLLK